MDSPATPPKDDRLTLISIAALACILQDLLHEGLGHGLTAWLSGAHTLTISTVALQSDLSTRWISANGTLVNLFFGAIFWLLLRNPKRNSPATCYFLTLALAGNLFTGTGYFLFSGIAGFGDWNAVIHGLHPQWMWRLGLVLLGVPTYFASMLLVGRKLQAFSRPDVDPRRIRRLSWTPYFTDGILAGLAGLLNPAGLFYVIASALPSTLGANAGLLSLPSMMRKWRQPNAPADTIRRSPAWIAVGAIASLLFIFVLGRGLSWSR
ncbi:MAG TPA: hypothetical protein VL128_13945 [Candidatus Eisenbacteria bacterium]|nr:hypothetical protein [Candidatus Eisenbacteria bacterium]